jgi:hypothetical protein
MRSHPFIVAALFSFTACDFVGQHQTTARFGTPLVVSLDRPSMEALSAAGLRASSVDNDLYSPDADVRGQLCLAPVTADGKNTEAIEMAKRCCPGDMLGFKITQHDGADALKPICVH